MPNIYAQYKKRIRAVLADYGRQGILIGFTPVKFYPAKGIPPTEGGLLTTRDSNLVFRDGATLKLYEKVQVINKTIQRLNCSYKTIQRLNCSYHYERPNGYFFRYEREETDDLTRKPEYHLHVILDLPHFHAPPVNLETIMKLITANFYSHSIYHKQIVGREINLTI